MAPARGDYRLKTGADEFFRYSAPKIVKYRVSESSKKIFCDEISAPFSPVNLESVTAQMSLYLTALEIDNRIVVQWKSGRCELDIPLPADGPAEPRIGPLACGDSP